MELLERYKNKKQALDEMEDNSDSLTGQSKDKNTFGSQEDDDDYADEEDLYDQEEDKSEFMTRTGDLDSRQSLVRFDEQSARYISVNLYICMQYCQGENLLKFIESRAKPSRRENYEIFKQIVNGVSNIHALQIVHRDMKPQNVFIWGEDNQVRIGDFGLAVDHMAELVGRG